ncbi:MULTISPECIES: type II toxin-antitoxin system RelE/ParE family toxin [unclassified Actinomyces]|uniref:type II toxin-antitoxin system RelE family toxin n=1 Tax=unclassified Actinomyces TaxID=2609248 RepID=UPI002017033A|nr:MULTISPECIES: type II toxin-antitoxin system RelE/ParE family toxin [unclassified Actinomyces]MCL3777220.1 type II toxin-antitoxin system RelE/ParE family toxin [Actinomyces sp. AC-20-1]MCL3789295.1 type II toxin-antitoxin system RelE/ParE family toxin [Actinomyces sp. 187325]MCL3791715.1 type II toxin-antitoxin system RelE/ParE family toxin [Actinomyces sp. 186855]MCL3794245.1 type II toxin-antitoxin system RelE/ParE family toxin [Actinomyces sp. 217892]
MADWSVELTPRAEKALTRLDRSVQERVVRKLREVQAADEPRAFLKPMTGPLAGKFRLRVGGYRVVIDVQDARCVILAIDVGHRSAVYDR